MAKNEEVKAYCVVCKKMRTMKSPKPKKMKNGMNTLRGTCVKCGCKMCKITGKA